MISTLGVVNYLCTCIAVNLMLIVCFKINPIEQRESPTAECVSTLTRQAWKSGTWESQSSSGSSCPLVLLSSDISDMTPSCVSGESGGSASAANASQLDSSKNTG